MTARILDGKALAATIKAELKDRVSTLAERGIVPGLGSTGTVLKSVSRPSRWNCRPLRARISWHR